MGAKRGGFEMDFRKFFRNVKASNSGNYPFTLDYFSRKERASETKTPGMEPGVFLREGCDLSHSALI